jgi:hypothetical protein
MLLEDKQHPTTFIKINHVQMLYSVLESATDIRQVLSLRALLSGLGAKFKCYSIA